MIGELVAPNLTANMQKMNDQTPWVKIVYRLVKMVFGLETEIILSMLKIMLMAVYLMDITLIES